MTPPASSWVLTSGFIIDCTHIYLQHFTVSTKLSRVGIVFGHTESRLIINWVHRQISIIIHLLFFKLAYFNQYKTVIAMRAASKVHFVTVAGLLPWLYSIHILCPMRTKSVSWIRFSTEIHPPLLHNFNSCSYQTTGTLISHLILQNYFFRTFDVIFSSLTTPMYDVKYIFCHIIFGTAPNPMEPKSYI
jgi:hypothetical protein